MIPESSEPTDGAPFEAPAQTEAQNPIPAVNPPSGGVEAGQNDLLSDAEYQALLKEIGEDDGSPPPQRSAPPEPARVEPVQPDDEPVEPQKLTQRRYTPVDPVDNEIINLAKERRISLVEAAALLRPQEPAPQAEPEIEPEPEPAPRVNIPAKLTEDRDAAYAELKKTMEEDWGNTDRILELQKETARLEREITLAEIETRQQQQTHQQRFAADLEKSRQTVFSRDPEVLNQNSPIHKEILRVVAEMQADQDPGLNRADLPERAYRIAARNLVAAGTPHVPAAPKPVENRPAQLPARPNPIGSGGSHTQQPTTARPADVDFMKMSDQEYRAHLAQWGLEE
jgi:hypothetical protein